MKRLFGIVFSLVVASSLSAQEIVRESISCTGKSFFQNGILLQQTTGQSSNTLTFSNDALVLRQGFLQPAIRRNQASEKVAPLFQFSLYPNPFHDSFSLEIPDELGRCFDLILTDPIGRVVLTAKVDGGHLSEFDMHEVQSGFYFASIFFNSELQAVCKLIKI